MYVNKPALVITDQELIQNGFYFKKMKINDLVNIVATNSNIVFETASDELRLKMNYIDSEAKAKLMRFIDEQSL